MDNTSYYDDQYVQIDGPGQLQPLKCITYNCQYLPKNIDAVSGFDADVVFLQSTCLQAKDAKTAFWVETKGKFLWIHSGASTETTKFTNKTGGCSIVLRKKKFKKFHIKKIEVVPDKVKGNCIFAKVKNGRFHLALFSIYPNLEKASADNTSAHL